MGEICFDGLGLHIASKACNPRHDCLLRCWEDRPVCIVEPVEVGILDETQLAHVVGGAGARSESVPKTASDSFWEMLIPIIPSIWRRFEEGCLSRYCVSWKRRVYAKREAAPASALSAEDNQEEEEKVKSRWQARERNWCKTSMVGAE